MQVLDRSHRLFSAACHRVYPRVPACTSRWRRQQAPYLVWAAPESNSDVSPAVQHQGAQPNAQGNEQAPPDRAQPKKASGGKRQADSTDPVASFLSRRFGWVKTWASGAVCLCHQCGFHSCALLKAKISTGHVRIIAVHCYVKP